jgi:2-oxoglutarate ferredoxin oxidoreductase subunit alpha
MSEEERPGAGTKPPFTSVSIALVGSGGAGVMTAGNMLLEAAAHAGYYALMTRSSGPQIRGGEAAAMIRISRVPIDCMDDHVHVRAAVDWDNVHRFGTEIPLGPDSLIAGDPDQGEPHEVFTRSGAAQAKVPLKKMALATWFMSGLSGVLGGVYARTGRATSMARNACGTRS